MILLGQPQPIVVAHDPTVPGDNGVLQERELVTPDAVAVILLILNAVADPSHCLSTKDHAKPGITVDADAVIIEKVVCVVAL